MSYKIGYLDGGEYRERDATPDEVADINERREQASIPVVPQSVPMLNAHLVLIETGRMAAVRTFLDAMAGPAGEAARAYFDKALTMRRDHPLVMAMPWPENEKDELFIAADKLVP